MSINDNDDIRELNGSCIQCGRVFRNKFQTRLADKHGVICMICENPKFHARHEKIMLIKYKMERNHDPRDL